MGYENRLYFIRKTPKNVIVKGHYNPEYHYAPVIAMLEVGKFNEMEKFFRTECKDTDRFVYHDNGNGEIIKDDCGEKLKEVSLQELDAWLDKMEEDPNINTEFVSFYILREMVNTFRTINSLYDDRIAVLHYGH